MSDFPNLVNHQLHETSTEATEDQLNYRTLRITLLVILISLYIGTGIDVWRRVRKILASDYKEKV